MKLANNIFGKQYYKQLCGGFAIGMENHVYTIKDFRGQGTELIFARVVDGAVQPDTSFDIQGMLIYKGDLTLKDIVLANPDTHRTLKDLLIKEIANWTSRMLVDFPDVVLIKVNLNLQ